MQGLFGVVRSARVVGYHDDGFLLFFVQLLQQRQNLIRGGAVQVTSGFVTQ